MHRPPAADPSGRLRYHLLPAFLMLLLATSCSSPLAELARGEELEKSGQHAAALAVYDGLLLSVPGEQREVLSEVHLRRAECLLRLGQPRQAFQALEKSVATAPENLRAHLRLGEMYLATGALVPAAEQARYVLARLPDNLDAQAVLATVYARSGMTDTAQELFESVLKADPQRLEVTLEAAQAHLVKNDFAAARAVLQRAAAAHPRSPVPLLALGRLEERQGNAEAAEAAYRQAISAESSRETKLALAHFLQRHARMREAEEVLVSMDGGQPQLSTALADHQLASGRPAKALHTYLRLLDRAERNSGSRAALAARALAANLEMVKQAEGPQRRPALARTRQVLDRHRQELDTVSILVLESEIALAADDLAGARLWAESAVKSGAESAAAQYALGAAKHRSGDVAGAHEAWQRALELSPESVPAHVALAGSALERGDFRRAEQHAALAVRQEPANLRALLLYARALAQRERLVEAVLVARRASAVDETRPEPFLVLGEIALLAGNLSDALLKFQQAVLLDPGSRAALEGLTSVYRRGTLTRPALRRMEAIAQNEPASATLMELVGRLYASRGWHQDAARCLRRAVEMGAETTARPELARMLAATGEMEQAAAAAQDADDGASLLLKAVEAEQRGEKQAAVGHYEAAVRRGERSGAAANNLAWIYAGQEQKLDRALHLARQARELAPQNPAVLDTLGFVHLKRREYSQAVEVLQSALRVAGESAGGSEVVAAIRRHLAEAYLRSGRTEDAAGELKKRAMTARHQTAGAPPASRN